MPPVRATGAHSASRDADGALAHTLVDKGNHGRELGIPCRRFRPPAHLPANRARRDEVGEIQPRTSVDRGEVLGNATARIARMLAIDGGEVFTRIRPISRCVGNAVLPGNHGRHTLREQAPLHGFVLHEAVGMRVGVDEPGHYVASPTVDHLIVRFTSKVPDRADGIALDGNVRTSHPLTIDDRSAEHHQPHPWPLSACAG
jgi:hypothetical protein